ncbi:MAG: response regulator [Ardenticatenaceae bacterium]|nr:response regulator [Ardenticatenaceae bacterium]
MARVLLVEDDHGIAILIGAILEDEGHRVVHAENVPDNLDLLKSDPVDLIICDLANGLSVEDRWWPVLALREVLDDVPILVCTAHPMAVLDAAQIRGVAGILPKPFGYDELVQRVQEILSGQTLYSG